MQLYLLRLLATASAPNIIPSTPQTEATLVLGAESTQGTSPILSTPNLPDLVKKFGQIKSKNLLQHLSELPSFQHVRQVFKDLTKKDFTASFNLKALFDAEKAVTDLHQAQFLSKAQYQSFLNFFENLQALREQYQKAERSSNRLRCFQEKHAKSTATLQQLVAEGTVMEERISVVDSEIQRLDEQLFY